MKQYKHKQTGKVAKQNKGYNISGSYNFYSVEPYNGLLYLPPGMVENTNDWEEIKHEEWEILTLKGIEALASFDKAEVGIYSYPMSTKYETRDVWVKSFLGSGIWSIYSVKRLSDGEVFTLGDVVKPPNISNLFYSITGFEVVEDSLKLKIKGRKNPTATGSWRIDCAEKVKSIFITEDGVEIFDKDTVVFGLLTKGTWDKREIKAMNRVTATATDWKYFSTWKALSQYELKHRPLLSLNDVRNTLWDRLPSNNLQCESVMKDLTDEVKRRMGLGFL